MFDQLLHMFNAGGLVMYPLVLFLFAATTIGFERFSYYRKYRGSIAILESTVKSKREGDDWKGLVGELSNSEDPVAKALGLVLNRAKNRMNLQSRLEDQIGQASSALKYGLDWLSMIVTMAPLLGLLGTVIGMIRSFQVMGGAADSPMVITGGVSEALIATAMGLCVAVVALIFHSCCAHRTNLYISKLEDSFGQMLDIYDGSSAE